MRSKCYRQLSAKDSVPKDGITKLFHHDKRSYFIHQLYNMIECQKVVPVIDPLSGIRTRSGGENKIVVASTT